MIGLLLSCITLLIIDIMQMTQIKRLRTALRDARKGSASDDSDKATVIDYGSD